MFMKVSLHWKKRILWSKSFGEQIWEMDQQKERKIGYYKKTEPNHLNNELNQEISFAPTKIPIWELFKRVRNQNNNR